MLTTKIRNDVKHGFMVTATSKRHGYFVHGVHLVEPQECLDELLPQVMQDVLELLTAGEIHTVSVSSINIPQGTACLRKEDLWPK